MTAELPAAVLVSTAVETDAQADLLATALVTQRLAACVQCLPVGSTYRWEGRIQRSNEILLLIKTAASRAADVQAYLRAHHPYTLPEILVTPVSGGLPEYLRWVAEESSPASR